MRRLPENLSVPVCSFVTMRDRDITIQGSVQAGIARDDRDDQTGTSAVFGDPIGYLAGFGITAEIVPNTETNSLLPVAA